MGMSDENTNNQMGISDENTEKRWGGQKELESQGGTLKRELPNCEWACKRVTRANI